MGGLTSVLLLLSTAFSKLTSCSHQSARRQGLNIGSTAAAALTALACVTVPLTDDSLSRGDGLPPVLQVLNWMVSIAGVSLFLLPKWHWRGKRSEDDAACSVAGLRLTALLPAFVLLSVSYEVLFVATLSLPLTLLALVRRLQWRAAVCVDNTSTQLMVFLVFFQVS